MASNFIAHYWVKTTDVVMFIDANSVMYIIMINHHDNTIIINIIMYLYHVLLIIVTTYSCHPKYCICTYMKKLSFSWFHEKLLTQNVCMKEKKTVCAEHGNENTKIFTHFVFR